MNTNNVSAGEDLSVYKVSEEGYLDQCLQETLESVKLKEFKELEFFLRECRVSEKKIKEFDNLFKECWEEFSQNTLKTELEENVAKCYQNHIDTISDGFYIEDPENFVCKDWC